MAYLLSARQSRKASRFPAASSARVSVGDCRAVAIEVHERNLTRPAKRLLQGITWTPRGQRAEPVLPPPGAHELDVALSLASPGPPTFTTDMVRHRVGP